MMKMLLNINHEGEGKMENDCQKLKKKSNVTLEKDFQQKWANHFLTVIFDLFSFFSGLFCCLSKEGYECDSYRCSSTIEENFNKRSFL